MKNEKTWVIVQYKASTIASKHVYIKNIMKKNNLVKNMYNHFKACIYEKYNRRQ